MKTRALPCHPVITGTVYAGALLLMASSALAQNLFVSSCVNPGGIYEYTPEGVPVTFTPTGLNYPYGLAFDSSGDLFVANCLDDLGIGGYVTEITPGGGQTTVPSGPDPKGLAFDSSGDLFVGTGYGNGNESITEIKPNKTQTTFATGLGYIGALAFNSVGDLFEADPGSGNIYEYTPGGVRSTFASLSNPNGLAFNSAGDLFVSSGSDIYEYTTNAVQSTFASGLDAPVGLAFQGLALPVPEPSTLALLAVGASALVMRLRRKA